MQYTSPSGEKSTWHPTGGSPDSPPGIMIVNCHEDDRGPEKDRLRFTFHEEVGEGEEASPGTLAHGLYYSVNRWKSANGERRAGRMLGFSGENAILEATWGQPGGGKVPWELLPAKEWNPITGRQASWNPLKGSSGEAE